MKDRLIKQGLKYATLTALLLTGVGAFTLGVPTPTLTEEQLLDVADIVVEGDIIGVVLTKKWIGDRPAIDTGYEQGNFKTWLLITKAIKGKISENDTVEFFTHAYMEGKWEVKKRFIYEGTVDAIVPGNKIRIYLKWNSEERRYERVHFNSGIVLLKRLGGAYPTEIGKPALLEKVNRHKLSMQCGRVQ